MAKRASPPVRGLMDEVLSAIGTHVVWTRSLDKPYQVWQQMAFALDAYLRGEPEQIVEIRAWAENALALPKALRDSDFRIHCKLLIILTHILILESRRAG